MLCFIVFYLTPVLIRFVKLCVCRDLYTTQPDDGQHRPKHVVVSITVIKYTSVIKLCLTTYLLLTKCNAEGKNEWRRTSLPPISLRGLDRDNNLLHLGTVNTFSFVNGRPNISQYATRKDSSLGSICVTAGDVRDEYIIFD